jgi:NDP-sugar pyrophosphorylase family protein
MMAVILAGGKGSRLQPFTITIPKPLLPLGDVPIIEVVIRQLAAGGVDRIVFTLGHMAHLFQALLGNGSQYDVEFDYVIEKDPLGTAAPLRQIPDLDSDFLVMNGDLLTTLPYADLYRFHTEQRAWGTIAIHRRQVAIDFGVVESTRNGRLKCYREKPVIPYDVSMGVNVLSRRCLDFIPKTGKFDMPDLMLAMRQAGKGVFCYRSDCYWRDIGRFDDYQSATEDYLVDAAKFIGPTPAITLRRCA